MTAAPRFECGVCWYVYNPGQGDPVWQIPPGTVFADLPESWCCPTCDSPRGRFMMLPDDG
jgi:rubredoxin